MNTWGQVEFFYSSNKNFNQQNYVKNMNFLQSIRDNNLTGFFDFIETGADVNFISNAPETPLSVAMYSDNLDMFSLLLKFGANANAPYNNGQSLIWDSLWENRTDFFKLMIPNIYKNTKEPNTGKTILMEAVDYSNLEAVKACIIAGFNVNDKDHKGNTALHYALNKDYYTETDKEIIEFLIRSGADVLAQNANGNTPEDVIKEDLPQPAAPSQQQSYGNSQPKQTNKQSKGKNYKKTNYPKYRPK